MVDCKLFDRKHFPTNLEQSCDCVGQIVVIRAHDTVFMKDERCQHLLRKGDEMEGK